MPLLGNAEKAELEALILRELTQHYEAHGKAALLGQGLRVVVRGDGVAIDRGETRDPLAAVEVRTLFTALCYRDDAAPSLPGEALASLASEAASATAAQINRLGRAR